MNVLGYVRVSTSDQDTEAQRVAIRAACRSRAWKLQRIAEDKASGKSLRQRPGLAGALDAMGEGDVLVAARLDRLSRSVQDFAAIIERARAGKWRLVVLDADVDTSSPGGEALVNVMAVFAQFERRLIGQRTKDALAVKRANGVRLGRPPTVSAEVRSRIHELHRCGLPQRRIAEVLTSEGFATPHGKSSTWQRSTVGHVLRCREAA